jgi:hypothetical protein
VLVQVTTDKINDRTLSSAFELREVAVERKAEIIAYFTSAGAGNLMSPIAITGSNT